MSDAVAKERRALLDQRSPREQSIASEVDPLVQSLGLALVDVRSAKVRDRMRVSIVLTGDGGPDIEQISRLHRLLMPRLEVLLDERDIDLELSSPGIGRELHRKDELRPFVGKPLEVMVGDAGQWQRVVLAGLDEAGIRIHGDRDSGGIGVISWTDLRRARLAEDDGGRG